MKFRNIGDLRKTLARMEVSEVISSVKLSKISLTEGLTFNLCISLTHFMVLDNTERYISHSRNVCIIEFVLEQKLQWSSVGNIAFFWQRLSCGLQVRCFKWQVVCSLNRTQECRKQQQGYLFYTNAVFSHKVSQQAHSRLVTTLGLPSFLYKHSLCQLSM